MLLDPCCCLAAAASATAAAAASPAAVCRCHAFLAFTRCPSATTPQFGGQAPGTSQEEREWAWKKFGVEFDV